MPYDSNGVWSLTPGYLAITGQVVSPTNHNPPLEDISTNGLSAVMVRDGRAPATGNWDMGGFRLGNLGTPVNPADAVTKAYADGFSNAYSLITTNTAVGAGDKGKWYRATSPLTLAPGAAATLGVNFAFNVKNDSTGNVVIDPSNGTEKINGIDQLIVPQGFNAFVICDGSNYFGYVNSSPLFGAHLQGYAFGMSANTNTGTPATNIDVSPGASASNASPYYLLQLLSTITKNTNNAWAVGTGNGSLDTGAIANSTYYGYIIQRSDTGVVDVLTSLSSTAPTMPANYDRRTPALFSFTRTAGVNGAPSNLGPGLLKYFESAEQTITNAGTLSLSHGLGAEPKLVETLFVCKTAVAGYTVGQKIPAQRFTISSSATDSYGVALIMGPTSIDITYGSSGQLIGSKTTGGGIVMVNANWTMVVRAWA